MGLGGRDKREEEKEGEATEKEGGRARWKRRKGGATEERKERILGISGISEILKKNSNTPF